ncbi:MAG: DUF4956 domain-containing protein [Chloroflexi bacterium]|nr:DUF4956 domain-containing protein [Chloroflexota bacterium]
MIDTLINTIRDYLQFDLANALSSIIPAATALIVALLIGMLIYFVYTKSYRGVIYSQSFAISLAGMTILTTMVTLAISSNIALSLGMVGALSIVRYRTAIKDPMDLLFLFWSVAVGIAIGAKMHYLAFLSSVVVSMMLMFVILNSSRNKKYIMVVHYSGDEIEASLRKILRGRRYQIKSKTIRDKDVEIAVEISVKGKSLAFINQIKELPTVNDITLVEYSGEYYG